MPDMEKVIKGLEHEIARTDIADLEWLDCVEVSLLRDALALLKAQEPHLVTESDFRYADIHGCIPVWIEHKERDGSIFEFGYSVLSKKSLNRIHGIRTWTSRPTDEQREAIPWN